MRIVLTKDRLTELLREAYEDGYDDAQARLSPAHTISMPTDEMWSDSVTADKLDSLVLRVRNGKEP